MEKNGINKKVILYVLVVLVAAVTIVSVGRIGGAFGLIKQFGLWIGFFALAHYRLVLVEWLLQFRYPTFGVYLLSALPFMLFEENINCLPSGCRLIPVTIPFLLLFLVAVFFAIKMTKIRSLWLILVPACAVGLLWEITVGVAGPEFRALPVPWFLYIALWTWMSYAFFTVVPVQYLLTRLKRQDVHKP